MGWEKSTDYRGAFLSWSLFEMTELQGYWENEGKRNLRPCSVAGLKLSVNHRKPGG